jgi:hypothetical protein
MKAGLLITLFLICVAFSGIAQTSPLVGTWKMVSGTMKSGDSTINDDMTKMESMKIVTPTHFAVFAKSTSTGDIAHAGAGTVKVEGNTYTETITYATGTGNKYPMIAKFTYELSGDRWHIKGGFDTYTFDEIWERVK